MDDVAIVSDLDPGIGDIDAFGSHSNVVEHHRIWDVDISDGFAGPPFESSHDVDIGHPKCIANDRDALGGIERYPIPSAIHEPERVRRSI